MAEWVEAAERAERSRARAPDEPGKGTMRLLKAPLIRGGRSRTFELIRIGWLAFVVDKTFIQVSLSLHVTFQTFLKFSNVPSLTENLTGGINSQCDITSLSTYEGRNLSHRFQFLHRTRAM
jgi:hypothetical protein